MTTVRVLITGSRTWDNAAFIHAELDHVAAEARRQQAALVVVHGGARGADAIAGNWVRERRTQGWPVTAEVHPADWDRHGKSAGHRRNELMVSLGADVCLAFIRDDSPGATGCARAAHAAGIRTVRVQYRP